jgi:hypothetical protein
MRDQTIKTIFACWNRPSWPENGHQIASATIAIRGGTHFGRLVWDHESVKQGTGPPTQTVVRIERGFRSVRGSLPRQQRNQASKKDISERTSKDRRRSESTLGKGKGNSNRSQETNNVSLCSSKDSSRATGQVGQGQARQEGIPVI